MAGKYNEQDKSITCSVCDACGGCSYTGVAYEEELKIKHKYVSELFKGIIESEPVVGMYRPIHYRNKVHGVVGFNKDKKIVTGIYQEGTHKLVPVDVCMIEDEESDAIMDTLCKLFQSFKYVPYNEDTRRGFMRHVLIRKGFSTKEIMVVLVTSEVAFPSKNAFIKELMKAHPQITTIVQNINNSKTSMVLGKRSIVLTGKGYIEDVLCGCRFRLSADTFYQINPAQTEKLYKTVIKAAAIKKGDTVIDAYCGVGTIGIAVATGSQAGKVIGVELNAQSVADAEVNARINNVKNISFVCGDAGEFLVEYAKKGKADVVIMDPPRSGSTPEFINSLLKIKPERIVYVSCDPSTQVRDIKPLIKGGYKVTMCKPFDMFPHTGHVETVTLLQRKNS